MSRLGHACLHTQFYLSGGVGTVGSDTAIDELVLLLLPYQLPAQYFFATQQAVDCLILKGKERVSCL